MVTDIISRVQEHFVVHPQFDADPVLLLSSYSSSCTTWFLLYLYCTRLINLKTGTILSFLQASTDPILSERVSYSALHTHLR
jgi:hypothetical protein